MGIFYYDRGQGEPLLLVHGMWGDHRDWEPVLEPLAENHRVIAVDLPGFGRSDASNIDFSARFFTAHLVQLLDQLGIEKAAVAGNSFGGEVALSLALDFPERVKKLILVNSGGLHQFSAVEKAMALLQRNEQFLRSLTPPVNTVLFSRLFFAQGSDIQERYIAKQNRNLERPDWPAYVSMMHRCMKLAIDLCMLDRLPYLRIPVLLIHGDQDPIVNPEWIREAFPLFPNARLAMFNRCGHVPQLEQPARFVQEVVAFLSEGNQEARSRSV